MCLLLVECAYCLWNVSVNCLPSSLSLLLCWLLVECVDCLWNVPIVCGMFRWICVYPPRLACSCVGCLWNVFIACGMCLLLVEYVSCFFVYLPRLACSCVGYLWNVSIACGMCQLQNHAYHSGEDDILTNACSPPKAGKNSPPHEPSDSCRGKSDMFLKLCSLPRE